MPGRARLHLDGKSANPSHVGILLSDHLLELYCLLNVCLLLKGHTEGKEKVAEDSAIFHLVKRLHQSLIGIAISFMNLSSGFRPDFRRESHQGFGSGRSCFKRLDKIDGGQSKGFKETFYPDLFCPDAGEEIEEILRPLGIRIEADMECLITIRDGFFNGLKNTLHASKGNFFSARDGHQRGTTAAAPGALDRTSSPHGEMIDRRLERIHPEILLLGNSLDIEGLTDISDVGGVILQQREVGEGEAVQFFL